MLLTVKLLEILSGTKSWQVEFRRM